MIRSIEKSNDLIGKLTRYLLACSIVPQPTMIVRAPQATNRYHTINVLTSGGVKIDPRLEF
jgi:hypothetical protein